jgi:hypothetical protein
VRGGPEARSGQSSLGDVFTSTPDIEATQTDVCFVPIADMPASVGLRGKAEVSSINRHLGERYEHQQHCTPRRSSLRSIQFEIDNSAAISVFYDERSVRGNSALDQRPSDQNDAENLRPILALKDGSLTGGRMIFLASHLASLISQEERASVEQRGVQHRV